MTSILIGSDQHYVPHFVFQGRCNDHQLNIQANPKTSSSFKIVIDLLSEWWHLRFDKLLTWWSLDTYVSDTIFKPIQRIPPVLKLSPICWVGVEIWYMAEMMVSGHICPRIFILWLGRHSKFNSSIKFFLVKFASKRLWNLYFNI